jgi:hypothetical protein
MSDVYWVWRGVARWVRSVLDLATRGFAADPPTGSGSTSQLIMRTYPDARLRADARGCDGGVREELEAGAKGVDRPAGGSIQNDSGLSQGLAGHFGGGSQTEAY